MLKEVKTLSLLDILPDSILADEQVAAAAKALDTEMQNVTKDIVEVLHLPRLDVLPEKVVDLLAWQFHVDFYDSSADLDTKRALVKQSIDWHRRMGTVGVVNSILKTISSGYHVEEWYEYGGKPYYFRIVERNADQVDYSDKEMIAAVNSVKNVRSWLESIVIDSGGSSDSSSGGGSGGGGGDEKEWGTVGNEYIGYVSGKHTCEATMEVTAEQGYWLDTTYIPLYWKGYHVPEGDGHQLTGKWQLDGTVQLDGTFTRHRHKWLGTNRFDGREWLDSRGNNQKHTVEMESVVEVLQSGNKMGFKLDGSHKLDSTWRLEWPKYTLYGHSATVTTIKDGIVVSEEAI